MTRYVLFMPLILLLALPSAGGLAYGQKLVEDEGPWRRDPFRYSAPDTRSDRDSAENSAEQETDDPALSGTQSELKLQGILLAHDGRYRALINGLEVRAGDRLGDVRILRISPLAVVVEEGGLSREINLFHHQIKWGKQ